jgi:HEPN domain-containing protein
MAKARSNEELGLWYTSRAYAQLNAAEQYFSLFRYPDSVICAYEAIEFSIKAMCRILNIKYNTKEHFPDASTLVNLAEKIGAKWPEKKNELLDALPTILGHTKELREICRYGIDKEGGPQVSPENLFRKNHCEKVLKDANQICDLLHRVDMRRRWVSVKW